MVYTLQNIQQSYSARTVLSIDTLEIPHGEIFAIVGPSGAGKSTLLRLLGLLESPTSGTVNITLNRETFNVDNVTIDQRRKIAMMFQRPALLSRSVHENVAYGLRIRNQYDRSKVDAVLEQVALSDLASAPAYTLSGGELQRVALARTLIINPQVLLLDEPTANLDPYNIRLIESLIKDQHSQHGTTIVIVTHNIFQAQRLATRVGLMLNGHMIETAPSAQFFNAPSDPRTRAFISGDLIY